MIPARAVLAAVVVVCVALGAVGLGAVAPAGAAAGDGLGGGDGEASSGATPGVEQGRVLVLSVPGLTWSDVADRDLPTLRALLGESSVANLAVRVTRLRTAAGDGYVTLGAGARTAAPAALAGLALAPQEPFEGGSAADAFLRRTGDDLDGAIGHLRIGSVLDASDASLLGGSAGLLGDTLAGAGVSRGVVANADPTPAPDGDLDYRREAALALVDSRGTIPCGRVDSGLLESDGPSPFGVRSDLDAVVAAAEACGAAGGVVLVEASDVRRAHEYGARATRAALDRMVGVALDRSDELARRLLAGVDPDRDAVVVVAPTSPTTGAPRLTVLGVRAPGFEPGLLVSGSTRQPGIVSIVDVAPTLAELAGVEFPAGEVDGRAVTVSRQGGDFEARLDHLVGADRDAQFRDRIYAQTVWVLLVLLLVLLAIATLRLWTGRELGRGLQAGGLGLLAMLPLTYLAAPLPFAEWGWPAYLVFVLGGGLVAGAAATTLGRVHWSAPLTALLGACVVVPVVSVTFLDSRLQLSTVLGDSPIVAGRFSGINNMTFAIVVASSILLGALFVRTDPVGGRVRMAVLFAAVLLVVGAPMWGADVGGVLSGLPALAFAGALLARWRVGWRTVAWWVVGTAVAIVALGLLDLTRAASDQSHLGRLFERIDAEGWDGFTTVVQRKLDASLRTLTDSVWRITAIPLVVVAALLVWRVPGPVRALDRGFPQLRAALVALGAAGVLGFALNDSGVAVPGAIVFVTAASAVHLVALGDAVGGGTRAAPVPDPERADARVAARSG